MEAWLGTQELLITVLREWTRAYGPLLLLLDDFDRADALSWSFLARCAEEIDTAVLVVAAIRPNDGIFAMPSLGHVSTLNKQCASAPQRSLWPASLLGVNRCNQRSLFLINLSK
jgi:hypothetical protein